MAEQDLTYFHHALKIMDDVCIGCTHCMSACPTRAIRLDKGTARIIDNRCIDCGECYRICPVNAITVEQDDFEERKKYRARVALIPGVLIGQFHERIPVENLYQVLHELGFTHVYEVENTAGFVLQALERENEESTLKPGISPFCPAVIRLVQVRYPSLVDNILRVKPLIDMSADYYREKLYAEGFKDKEIGIFYVTPCAAKIASIKSPVDNGNSAVNGVINMKFLYNRMNSLLKNHTGKIKVDLMQEMLSSEGICWSLTNGEHSVLPGKGLAVDGIHQVNNFLDQLENGEQGNFNFLEMRACDQSCAGGILVGGNRFLTAERIKKRSKCYPLIKEKSLHLKNAPADYRLGHINPRPVERLDEDMLKAMKKMERRRKLMCYLPGIDCGACGAPDCQSLAEDIVQGDASISQCIFLLQDMVNRRAVSKEKAGSIISSVWGRERFDKDCKKRGAKDENS